MASITSMLPVSGALQLKTSGAQGDLGVKQCEIIGQKYSDQEKAILHVPAFQPALALEYPLAMTPSTHSLIKNYGMTLTSP